MIEQAAIDQQQEFDMMQIREQEQRLDDAADNAFTSEGGFIGATTIEPRMEPSTLQPGAEDSRQAADEARRRVMEEAAVTSDGRHYYYDGHRYSGLAEAVDHSVLMRSQPLHAHQPGPFTITPAVHVPTDADAALMAALGIHFVAGIYKFESYRYDRLDDAVGYARLRLTKVDAVAA